MLREPAQRRSADGPRSDLVRESYEAVHVHASPDGDALARKSKIASDPVALVELRGGPRAQLPLHELGLADRCRRFARADRRVHDGVAKRGPRSLEWLDAGDHRHRSGVRIKDRELRCRVATHHQHLSAPAREAPHKAITYADRRACRLAIQKLWIDQTVICSDDERELVGERDRSRGGGRRRRRIGSCLERNRRRWRRRGAEPARTDVVAARGQDERDKDEPSEHAQDAVTLSWVAHPSWTCENCYACMPCLARATADRTRRRERMRRS